MSVQIDAHVLLQVSSHLNAAFPAASGGILLGTGAEERPHEDVVCVTESFALPQQVVEAGTVNLRSAEASNYMDSMISKLKFIGSDHHVEGWYISSSVGGIYDSQVFDNLYSFQKTNKSSFLLVNDVALNRSTKTTSLRAFRLSEEFLKLKEYATKNKISTEQLLENQVDYTNLLVELHVSVVNPTLVSTFVQQHLAKNTQKLSTVSGALSVPDQELLELRGDAVMDTVDDLNYEQGNYNYYQRQLARERTKITAWQQKRKAENAVRAEKGEPELPLDGWKKEKLFNNVEEPSRLENLLLSAQLDEHCNELEELVGTTSATILPTKFIN